MIYSYTQHPSESVPPPLTPLTVGLWTGGIMLVVLLSTVLMIWRIKR